MLKLLSASGLLFAAASAAAQNAPSTLPPSAQVTPPSPATQSAAFDGNTPLEKIVADPAAKAALDKDLPGVSTHPAFDQVKAKSLRDVLPVAQPLITQEKIAAFETDMKSSK